MNLLIDILTKLPITTMINLIIHMGMHSGKRPYKCSIFDKELTDISTFIRHMNYKNLNP